MLVAILLLAASMANTGVDSRAWLSARQKLLAIQNRRVEPGSRVSFTTREVNAYLRHAAATMPSRAVLQPVITLDNGAVRGKASIDFLNAARASGIQDNWLLDQLFGEPKPVEAEIRVRSGGGKARVDVQSAAISGVALSGEALGFVMKNIVMPNYPNVKLGQDFELDYRIDRIEITPGGVDVYLLGGVPGKASKLVDRTTGKAP